MKIFKSISIGALLLRFNLGIAQNTYNRTEEVLIRSTIMDYINGTANGKPGGRKSNLSFDGKGEEKTMSFIIGKSAPLRSTRVAPTSYDTKDLEAFVGTYYCEPLSTTYEFVVEDGILIARNLRTEAITFKPNKKGLFESDQGYFGGIQFKRSASVVEEFTLSSDEVRAL